MVHLGTCISLVGLDPCMGMEKRRMKFVDAEEMELFYGRYFAKAYEDRLYMRKEHLRTLSAINEKSSVLFDSVLPDNFTSIVFECWSKWCKEASCSSQQSSFLSIECDGYKRATFLDNIPGVRLDFTTDDASDTLTPSLKSYLNLIHCLLSSAASLRDPWSVTRFLSRVCPNVLPALRRRAQQSTGYLNVMSVLISYVMTGIPDDESNMDVELHVNYKLLKQFVDTIINMNEMLQGDSQPIEAVKSVIKTAAKFLVTLPNFNNSSVVAKMTTYLDRHVDEVSTNFAIIKSSMSEEFQIDELQRLNDQMKNELKNAKHIAETEAEKLKAKADEQQQNTSNRDIIGQAMNEYPKLNIPTAHMIAISLCDRLTCLNVAEDVAAVSPLFKTPTTARVAVPKSPAAPVVPKEVVEEVNVTPERKQNHIASFININTPESKPPEMPENIEDRFSMKENIPVSSEDVEEKRCSKAASSLSRKKGLSCRQLNLSFVGKKCNQRKPSKKNHIKGQTKITSFFRN